MNHIRTATLNGVATIEIARPEKKNALTVEMYQAMADAVNAAAEDAKVRALLVTGQPGIFTSGNDLQDFLTRPRPLDLEGAPVFRFMRALIECDKPIVAAVTGAAIGIGTTMLLHCDFVFASDEARLSMPFTSLGIVPEFGSSLLVPSLMGPRRAAERLLLGDPFSAEQAVECGIANAVLPAAEVLPHARRVAERFNALPPGAVSDTKRLMRGPQRAALLDAVKREGAIFTARLAGAEAREAMQAVLEKRKPDFSAF
jgi:enoyl-CoA hydratase/carnithine racemase